MISKRHLVDTRHGQMHVRTSGQGGTPLVLLHSQVVGGRLYDMAVPLLAQDRLVIVPDRIGYGDSDPLVRSLSFPEFAEATLDALDALGVARADFAGIHSGSMEVVELATAHPERVNRLVVVTLSVFTDAERPVFKGYFGPSKPPADDGSHLLEAWGWWFGARPAGLSLDVVQGWAIDHLSSYNWFWQTFIQAIDYPLAERLPLITQPVLAILPHDDVAEQSQRSLALLPAHAEIVDAPHMTQVMGVFTEHVEEVVGHIRRFLS